HNAGDNAETMLFNFFRGSGIDGLKGILPSTRIGGLRGVLPSGRIDGLKGILASTRIGGANAASTDRFSIDPSLSHENDTEIRLIRPLLFAGRAEIAQFMKARRLRHREDATNATSAYSRNYLRRRVIPSIEKRINPSLERTLNTEAALFHACSDFVGSIVDRLERDCITLMPHGFSIVIQYLASSHVFIQQMLIKRCFLLLGIEPNFVHIEEIVRLVSGGTGKTVDCGGGIVARRTHASIEIGTMDADVPFLLNIDGEGSVETRRFTFCLRTAVPPKRFGTNRCIEYVDAEALELPLTIRPWQRGDWFMPIGMKSKKKLSDFFADLKIPREQKARIPIVISGNSIVWVAGLRLDDRFKVTPHTQSVYQLSIKYHT
ncbi:MAG TPA: tRNA lysidine(34) synthetase TilS, partial [Bacteroidota bacterium]|nr:tRNA lysidine(34) synthetase TilS [Bacteroidota bacterium]